MSVRNVVKVMNFHALLRVNNARRKVERAFKYERELKYIIATIVNNRIFNQEQLSLELSKNEKELNIYIGSDLGFCASFNSDVIKYIKEDKDANAKVIIGKKINIDVPNKILYLDHEKFETENSKLYDLILQGIIDKEYSKINIIYIHYYNMNKQEIIKRTLLPFDLENDVLDQYKKKEISKIDDFVVEGDLSYILFNLISLYVQNEIKIAEAWGFASENVERQVFTHESLKKIDEKEEEKVLIERKIRHNKEFKQIVERNNKQQMNKKKEE